MIGFQEYLNSLNPEEKEYVSSFYKRKEYIEKLNETAINSCNDTILSSKGNCNSKIAIIINSYTNLDTVSRFIKPLFESINTSLWNIYITSIIKSDNESNIWNQMIQHELNAVSPLFGFMFVDDKQSFSEEEYVAFNKTFPVVYINILFYSYSAISISLY